MYFDLDSRYAKALVRWVRMPKPWLLAVYSMIAGAPVRRVAPPAALRGSPRLNVDGMKRVTRIVAALGTEFENQGWNRLLSGLIGDVPACAYFHRRFPWHEIWPQVLAVTLTVDALDGEKPLVMWNVHWPERWERVAEAELREAYGVEFFRWPNWYRRLARHIANVYAVGLTVWSSMLRMVPWRFAKGSPVTVPLAIEFIEPSRLGGGPFDSNFLEDGVRIRREDSVYFLTSEQARLLRRDGQDVEAMVASARAEGFRVEYLNKSPWSRQTARMARQVVVSLFKRFPRLGAGCMGYSFFRGWKDIVTYSLLFDSYRPLNVLHSQNPNGHSGFHVDSAVVTGLCRKFGSRSVGYQSRCTYDTVYEDSYDCYDVYLAWGRRWRDVLGDGNRFIGRIIEVGCIDNQGRPARGPVRRDEGVVLAVFTTELQGNLFSKRTVANLLETCVGLAARFPECRFKVKMKDPDNVDTLLDDEAFRNACQAVERNFAFVRLPRHHVADVIDAADIVIASAWTTPGSDALLRGRRVIFYSEMGAGGKAFDGLPNIVASSPAELTRLFEIALEDYAVYGTRHGRLLAGLDPFRDGRARERIVVELFGHQAGTATPRMVADA